MVKGIQTLKKSFEIKKEFFYSIGVDLLFYLFIIIIGTSFYNQLSGKFLQLLSLDASKTTMEGLMSISQSTIIKLYSTIFFMILFFIIFYSMFKGLVWSFTTKTAPTKKYMRNFSKLSTIWVLFWLLIVFLFWKTATMKDALILILGFVVMNYFTKILFISFSKYKGNIKKSYNEMIDIAFKKGNQFVIPYLIEFVMFLILFVIMAKLTFLPKTLFISIIYLTFLLYSAWTRKYFYEIIKTLK